MYDKDKAIWKVYDMEILFWLLGGFCAVAFCLFAFFRRLGSFSRRVFGTSNLLKGLESVDALAEESPRSLNGCDNLLLPQILKDFPDFDVNTAKANVRKALNERFGTKPAFKVYNIVMAKYLRSGAQKTIVFQAALSWTEAGKTQQKRYDIHYCYLLKGADETVAANCPNCGGALGYGETECPYCGSRVAHVLGNSWQFLQFLET